MIKSINIIIAALALLLSACAPATVPFEAGAQAPTPQGCIDGRARGVDCLLMSTKAKLAAIFQDVKGRFTYVPDNFQFHKSEYWMEPELLDGNFKGDCDDFALACRKMVRAAGLPSRLIYCKTEKGEPHLVLACEGWILNNLLDFVVSNTELDGRYTWVAMSGFNQGDPWTRIKPIKGE